MPTYVPYRVDTMSMMPLGGVRRIDRKSIHRSAWNTNSRKVTSKILHMRRPRDTFRSGEAEIRCEGDHNFWCRGYRFKITNAAFVAA
jgi:hypothetical protein